MNKKKLLKIIGIILLVVIVLFLIHSIRNFIIISNLQDKVEKYANNDNYHLHTISQQSEQVTLTTDYYKKNNREVTFLERNSNGEITKISLYNNGERIDMFVDSPTTKTAKINTNALIPGTIVNALQTDNKWQTFLYSILAKVRSTSFNNKDGYIIENFLSPFYLPSYENNTTKYIIEKDTGLLLKEEVNNIVAEKKYEFNSVDDNIFVEPDISQYTIQEDQ